MFFRAFNLGQLCASMIYDKKGNNKKTHTHNKT